jgi:hypothetical protein
MKSDKDKIRDEYPEELIKSGVRGKHTKRFREGTNVVLILIPPAILMARGCRFMVMMAGECGYSVI